MIKASLFKRLKLNPPKPRVYRSAEAGSTLFVVILVTVSLSLIGVFALKSSHMEALIAGNDCLYRQIFYAAESGWQVAINWLRSEFPGVTDARDTTDVAKYLSGDPEDTRTWIELPASGGVEYSIDIEFGGAVNTPGYSTDFKRFSYVLNATGRKGEKSEAQLSVGAGRVYYVGGY